MEKGKVWRRVGYREGYGMEEGRVWRRVVSCLTEDFTEVVS